METRKQIAALKVAGRRAVPHKKAPIIKALSPNVSAPGSQPPEKPFDPNQITPTQQAAILELQKKYEDILIIYHHGVSIFSSATTLLFIIGLMSALSHQYFSRNYMEFVNDIHERITEKNQDLDACKAIELAEKKSMQYILPAIVIFIFSTKFFIIDRLIAKLEMKFRGVSTNNLLSLKYDEADTLIRKLNDLITTKIHNEMHYEMLGHLLMFGIFLVMTSRFLFDLAFSESLVFILLGCTASIFTALPGSIQQVSHQSKTDLDYNLNHIKNILSIVTAKLGQPNWEAQPNTALTDSFLTLKTINYGYRAKTICQVIINSFKEYGFHANVKQDGKSIIISSDIKITVDIAKNIHQTILKLLDELSAIEELKNQLHIIQKKLNLCFAFNQSLKRMTPEFIAYTVLDHHEAELREKLSDLFGESIAFNGPAVTITRTTKLPHLSNESLVLSPQGTSISAPNISSPSLLLFAKKKKPTERMKVESAPEIVPSSSLALPKDETLRVKWASAEYDSSNPHCGVFPFTSTLPKNRFFATSTLTEADFGDKSTRSVLFKLFQKHIEHPTVAAQKGSQGFVLDLEGTAKTPAGTTFPYQAKIKCLGKPAGDARVFCSLETSPNGEVLYVARGINLHSH